MGEMVNGKFKHFFTIGRESTKEFKSDEISRKRGKNELPALLTEDMVEHAFGEWKLGRQQKKTWKRKRDEDSLP